MSTGVAPLTLRSLPVFSGLSEHRLVKLASEASLRNVPRGEVVVREGDPTDSIYFVINGRLRVLVSDSDGREVILSMLSAGDMFGELGLIDDNPRSATVVAIDHSDLVMFYKDNFRNCLSENPDIMFSLMRSMATRMRSATQHIESLALLDVFGRVARLLLEMAEDVGGRKVVRQRPTKQDIAKMVGASREMVSRVMKALQNEGLIEDRNRQVVILDKAGDAFGNRS